MRLTRSKPYRLIQAIRFASFTLAAVASGVLGLPESSDPDATRFLASLNEWGWWVVFGSMIVGGGATVWMRSTDRHGLEGVLGDVLEDFRAELFGKQHRGDHRVTLFAYRRFWWGAMLRIMWPRTGWLIPVARSGHTKQRSGTYFRVPDDDSRARGSSRTRRGRAQVEWWRSMACQICKSSLRTPWNGGKLSSVTQRQPTSPCLIHELTCRG